MDISQTLSYILFLNFFTQSFAYLDGTGLCEPIRIDMCAHLKYNMTAMPNYLGHSTQEEAISDLKTFSQLASLVNCSEHINFFLCSLFAPMCTMQLDGPLVINVCRSMCLQVSLYY